MWFRFTRYFVLLRLVAVCCVCVIQTACTPTPNNSTAGKLHSTFFLVQGTPNQIARATNTDFIPNWNSVIGIANPTDIAVAGGFLYACDAAAQKIVKYDIDNNRVVGSFSTPGPIHAIAIGERFVLMVDSVNKNIHLLKTAWGLAGSVSYTVGFTPKAITYNADKFYVAGSMGNIAIFNETAAALTNIVQINNTRQTVTAAINKNKNPVIVTRNTGTNTVWLTYLNPNAALVVDSAATINSRILFTPFLKMQLGSEYLQDVKQTGNQINIPTLNDTLSAFEMDFRTSALFYQARDTVFRYNVRINRTEAAWPVSNRLIKAGYYYVAN